MIVRKDLIYFILWFCWLILITILVDGVFHSLNMLWFGRYAGIFGVALILISFLYYLRKKKIIKSGSMKSYLLFHEWAAWSGSLLILIHSGVHFNAIIPWLGTITMLIAVVSGLTGKYLLKRSRESLDQKQKELEEAGQSPREIEEIMFWDSVTYETMKKWRVIHRPITLAFAVLSVIHIVIILFFWKSL